MTSAGIEPSAAAAGLSIVTVNVTSNDSPDARSRPGQVTFVHGLSHVPPSLAETNVVPAGIGSSATTPVRSAAPGLVTCSVYFRVSPYAAVALSTALVMSTCATGWCVWFVGVDVSPSCRNAMLSTVNGSVSPAFTVTANDTLPEPPALTVRAHVSVPSARTPSPAEPDTYVVPSGIASVMVTSAVMLPAFAYGRVYVIVSPS